MNENMGHIKIWTKNLTITRLLLSSKGNEMLPTLSILDHAQA